MTILTGIYTTITHTNSNLNIIKTIIAHSLNKKPITYQKKKIETSRRKRVTISIRSRYIHVSINLDPPLNRHPNAHLTHPKPTPYTCAYIGVGQEEVGSSEHKSFLSTNCAKLARLSQPLKRGKVPVLTDTLPVIKTAKEGWFWGWESAEKVWKALAVRAPWPMKCSRAARRTNNAAFLHFRRMYDFFCIEFQIWESFV